MGRKSRNFLRAGVALGVIIGAAPSAASSSDYYLKLDGIDAKASGGRHRDQIEVLSFSWGATQAADTVDPLTDGLLLVRFNNGPRQTTSADGIRVAAGDVNGDGRPDLAAPPGATGTAKFGAVSGIQRDSSMGRATGKRQHKPIRMRGYYDSAAPPAAGSLTIAGNFPGCRVGARYPRLTLAGGGKRFTMQDAIVSNCARGTFQGEAAPMEEVSFNYAKIQY